ncbi:MAG: PAS domain-containing protein [archaeon]
MNNKELEKYLDLVRVIMLAIDKEGIVTYINKKGCELLGYDKEEIIGKNWFENFLPERLRNQLKEYAKKLLSGDIKLSEYHENPVLCKDGSEKIIAWNKGLIKDENNKIIGCFCSGQDITQKRKTEYELKGRAIELSAILDTVPAIIWSKDLRGRFLILNKYFTEFFGIKEKDLLGKTDFDYSPKELAEHYTKDDEEVTKTGKPKLGIIERFKKANGSIGWLKTDKIPFIDPDNRIIGTIGFAIDITQEKEAENNSKE